MNNIYTTQSLTRIIAANRKAFSNYNTVRMREVVRYLTDKKLELFLKIPFLLHINAKSYPGYVEASETLCGITNFQKSGCFRLAIKEKLFPKSIVEYIDVKDPVIMALYHIGSLGTFTQSRTSDFDFWVIVDEERFTPQSYHKFEQKLDGIVKYCRETYDQEVTFFIMDYKKIKDDIYQSFEQEDTLTVPKIFLKEEFYRTYLMIAGKIPIWSLLPSDADETDRNRMTSQILPVSPDLIDLGHVSKIPFQDIIKGLLWHIGKSIEDPIKALIKATTIFSYEFGDQEHQTLLCEKIKDRYGQSGIDDFRADPYKVVFDRILDFHERCDPKGIHLIKNAIFFRLCSYPYVRLPEEKSPKRLLLNQYIRKWRLKSKQVTKLLSYSQWSEAEKVLLERAILQRLAQMFNQTIKNAGNLEALFDTDAQKTQWRILKNITRTRLQSEPGKIESCSTYLKKLGLSRIVLSHKNAKWINILIPKDKNQKAITYAYPSFGEALGFVLENELYKRHTSRFEFKADIQLFENETRAVSLDDVYMAVSPVKPLTDICFASDPVWSRQLVFLFFNDNGQENRLEAADILAISSWGQVYTKSITFDLDADPEQIYTRLAQTIEEYADQHTRFHFYQASDTYVDDIIYQVKKSIENITGLNTQTFKRKNKPLLDIL